MWSRPFQSTLSVRRATPTVFTFRQPLIFQSTLSVRRATFHASVRSLAGLISIHALRKESDRANHILTWCSLYFNPRSP